MHNVSPKNSGLDLRWGNECFEQDTFKVDMAGMRIVN